MGTRERCDAFLRDTKEILDRRWLKVLDSFLGPDLVAYAKSLERNPRSQNIVSGTIERTHVTTPSQAALIAKFRTAKPLNNRGSDIVPGSHVFALIDYSFRPTDNAGMIIGLDLEVMQSTAYQPGTKCRDAFFVSKPKQEGGDMEVGRAMQFTNALVNAAPDDADAFAAESDKLSVPTQPGRGLLIKCVAVSETKPAGKNSKKHAPGTMVTYINKTYEHVPDQSNQPTIRAALDQKYPLAAVTPAQPPAGPQPGYYTPPPGQPAYGWPPAPAPAGAPHGYGPPPAGYPAYPTTPPMPAGPPPGWPPGYPWPPPAAR